MVELSNRLYALGLAPKGWAVQEWLSDLEEAGVELIYVLGDFEQAISRMTSGDAAGVKKSQHGGLATLRFGQRDLPVLDRSGVMEAIDEELGPHNFWETVFRITCSMEEDATILLVDGENLAQATAVAVAVHMIRGSSYETALEQLGDEHQPDEPFRELLSRGITEPVPEREPDDDSGTGSEGWDDVLNPPQEKLDQFQTWWDAPDNRNREEYYELQKLRQAHPSLKQHGLRSIIDPLSRQWNQTSRDAKYEAFSALIDKTNFREEDHISSIALGFKLELVDGILRYTGTNLDRLILGGSLLLHGALDKGFIFPVSPEEVQTHWNRYHELLDGRKVSSVANRFHKLRLPTLGRDHFDSLSHEGETTPVESKIADVRSVLEGGVPLLDAVMVHRYRYREKNRRYVIEQLPLDLFALTAVVLKR